MANTTSITLAGGAKVLPPFTLLPAVVQRPGHSPILLASSDLKHALAAAVLACEDLVQGSGFGPTCPVTRAEAAYEAAQDAARAVLRLKPLHASDPMLQIVAQLIDFGLGMESEADRTAFQGMMLALVPLWRASAATPTARMAVQIVRCSLTAFVRLSEAMHTPIQSAAVQVMATALAQSPLSSPGSADATSSNIAIGAAAF